MKSDIDIVQVSTGTWCKERAESRPFEFARAYCMVRPRTHPDLVAPRDPSATHGSAVHRTA